MPIVHFSELETQLNIGDDGDDSQLLEQKIAAAEAYCASFIGTAIPNPAPAAIHQAVLMLSAYWFEMREAATSGGNPYTVPFGVHELLQAHRTWVV